MKVELDEPDNWNVNLKHAIAERGTRIFSETTYEYFNTLYRRARNFETLIERKEKSAMFNLKEEITRVAKESDMDLVGFAGTDRFEDVHYRMRPQAHLPGAVAVVSMAMRYPKAMYELAGNTEAESYMSLDSYEKMHMQEMLMIAAMDVTRYIEKAGFLAIPMQITHYRVHPYKDIEESWTQDFDHRIAAVAAGLGELGIHGVPDNPRIRNTSNIYFCCY